MDLKVVIVIIWIGWVVSWVIAAAGTKATQAAPRSGSELPYRLLQGTGFALLFTSLKPPDAVLASPAAPLFAPLWTLPTAAAWAVVALTVAGFLFAWWARLHLGALWSSSVTRKQDHRIVDSGPYGLVRHPIYTGLLAAAAALAAVDGTAAALIGFALIVTGVVVKARLEERFLRSELGADAYDAYRVRVPMLVPFAK